MDIEKNQKKSLEQFRKSLPIYKYRSEIIKTIKDLSNQVVVIAGETGCGKTTQIPQYLFEENLNKNLMIGITQPRRVAAITVSARVSAEKNCVLGDLVGYSIRFEEKIDKNKTKIKFMTDGMLLRECIIDPLLKKYSILIIDEAHERTLASDILMGLLKNVLSSRTDLKLIIMSATIEIEKFMRFFETSALIQIEGRFFPIEIYYTKEPEADYLEATMNTILQLHFTEEKGDILAFLTGQEDIDDLEQILQKKNEIISDPSKKLEICPLYSALPSKVQLKSFEPQNENLRKVILATNIAETSVTIDGIKFVVDSGLVKIRNYNPNKDIESLIVTEISKSSAMQRAGRAGRQSRGKCFRLYTEESFGKLKKFTTPEILRVNLCHAILEMKAIGIKNIHEFNFVDKPKEESITRSIKILQIYKALDLKTEELTPLGKEMAELPLDPAYSHELLLALEPEYGCSNMILDVISILSVENLFYFPKELKNNLMKIILKYKIGNSDHLTKANIFHKYLNAKNKTSFCKENFINKKSIKKAVLIREQLADYLAQIQKKRGKPVDSNTFISKNIEEIPLEKVLKCLGHGYFLKTAKLNSDGSYNITKTNQTAYLHPESLCFYLKNKPEYIVYNEVVITKKTYLRDVTEIAFTDFKEYIREL